MIYAKSLLAGLLAAVLSCVALVITAIVTIILYMGIHPPQGDGSVGWDPISLARRPPVWLAVALITCFCGGFSWEYRRLHKR
jgi:hypothetical protein